MFKVKPKSNWRTGWLQSTESCLNLLVRHGEVQWLYSLTHGTTLGKKLYLLIKNFTCTFCISMWITDIWATHIRFEVHTASKLEWPCKAMPDSVFSIHLVCIRKVSFKLNKYIKIYIRQPYNNWLLAEARLHVAIVVPQKNNGNRIIIICY